MRRATNRGLLHGTLMACGLVACGLTTAGVRSAGARSDLFLLEAAPSVSDVVFAGNERFTDGELKDQIGTRARHWLRPFRDARLVRSQLEQDVLSLAGFYRARGFLRVQVSAAAIQGVDGAEVHFRIVEGSPVAVSELDLRGLDDSERDRFLKRLRTQPGRPLNPYQLENDRTLVQAHLADTGHPLGVVEESTIIRGDSALVHFVVRKGPEVRFGAVEFEGAGGIARWPVRREQTFRTGELFRRREVTRTQQRLYDTGLFSDVQFVPDTTLSAAGELGGVYRLRQRRHNWVAAGVGYSNTGGSNFIRLSGEWGTRNLFHTARGLSVKSQNSFDLPPEGAEGDPFFRLREHRDNARLVQPWLFGRRLRGELGGFFQYDNLRVITVRQTSYGFTGGVSKELRERVSNVAFNLEARWTKNRVDPEVNLDSLDVQLRRPRYSTRLAGLSFGYDDRDDYINPNRGVRVTTLLQYAGDFLGGDNNFDKAAVSGSRYRRLGRRTVLATRLALGGVNPLKTFEPESGTRPVDDIPVEDRFYTGGSASVRGYQENTINGVQSGSDPNGGGLLSVLANAELRFGLLGPLGGVLFADAGEVWIDANEIRLDRLGPTFDRGKTTLSHLRWSLGGGLRLNTPVGPIRLEGAWRLSPRSGDRPQDIHFAIGQAF